MRRLQVLCVVAVLAAGCGTRAAPSDGPVADDAPTAADDSGTDTGTEDGALPDGPAPDGPPDSGGDAPGSCQWSATNPCGPGHYCKAFGCGPGVCTPVPTQEQDTRMPVCGCDLQTYWNESVAAAHGMAVKSSGACPFGASCGGFAGLHCPTHAYCNYHLADQSSCGGADMPGTCWVLPATCPSIMIGPTTRQCGAVTCTGECQLIKAGVLWYDDHTCPV